MPPLRADVDELFRGQNRLRLLITGGAGFIGASLAVGLQTRHDDWDVVCLDNLRRRGAELNLPRLRAAGVAFVYGDVREAADLEAVGVFDAVVECSAEPSALAGTVGDTRYVVHSNLMGAYNVLDLARRHAAQLVFLSTSRVYPVAALGAVSYRDEGTRFALLDDQALAGVSAAGISEAFPLEGARTLYGATKLAVELLVAEYAAAFGLRTVVNRCGVVAGPWQMGKVDQGVFTYWLLCHYFGRDLAYIGYGGSGKQVRDVLHVADLVDLVDEQLLAPERWSGVTVNVGGGGDCSLSLIEATAICEELTGRRVPITRVEEPRPGDVPIYVSDCRRLASLSSWRPTRSPRAVLEDTLDWIAGNERDLLAALG